MSKGKEKVIEVNDDELDFLPSLLVDPAFDPRIPLEPIRPSIGTSARRISPEATISNSDDDESFGLEDTLSEDPGEDSVEVSSLGVSRPERKSNLRGRALAENYIIDLMTYMTTIKDFIDLRTIYDIPNGIPLKGFNYKLKPNVLKWVKTVLANSCSCRELLSTYNLFESRLIPTNLEMEDAVIGAMNRKRPRPNAAKRDHHKDTPLGKQVNTVKQVAHFKTLPPPPKAG
ncbi:hypothetical protein CISIN_1g048555mg [Citrus sinensis]|uniref:Uncharacterized protein n=1 Tax=Citrus sinensis TaxID=2711 RepID=A0A067DNY6_CITSI|nr:hypothetical protein CISIN_1g048555mg [Citrus sinensis]